MLHKSVLLKESIDKLNIKEDGIYVDATLGYAGHASAILKRIPNGFLYGIDQDDYAIKCSNEKLREINNNYKIIKDNFINLKKDISYIKQLLIQTYADLNLEYVDTNSSDSLDKFNKKYHKRNMND